MNSQSPTATRSILPKEEMEKIGDRGSSDPVPIEIADDRIAWNLMSQAHGYNNRNATLGRDCDVWNLVATGTLWQDTDSFTKQTTLMMVAIGPTDGPDPNGHVVTAPGPSNVVTEPGHVFDVLERISHASQPSHWE
ncbi:hypothetical protein N8T08_001096 [Aspergillus melleus]|uniref:Uncharacterized protein n=1 Tax=Aspergillus melleus TaxID=138277 RepID=A0ACC3AP58_9EURO|nr:hypothetical protein N8T08_001096 [Aspergillus melleus]